MYHHYLWLVGIFSFQIIIDTNLRWFFKISYQCFVSVSTPILPQAQVMKLSKPTYQNEKLQQKIEQNKTSELSLSQWNLTDDDMQTIAYYAIQQNQVSYVINSWFCIIWLLRFSLFIFINQDMFHPSFYTDVNLHTVLYKYSTLSPFCTTTTPKFTNFL